MMLLIGDNEETTDFFVKNDVIGQENPTFYPFIMNIVF